MSMVTSFRVGHGGWLTYADRAASGGVLPISLTSNEEGDVLYALNELTGTIQGFHVSHNGRRSWIDGSNQSLNPGGGGGVSAGIGFARRSRPRRDPAGGPRERRDQSFSPPPGAQSTIAEFRVGHG
jgi:hypothetical protein